MWSVVIFSLFRAPPIGQNVQQSHAVKASVRVQTCGIGRLGTKAYLYTVPSISWAQTYFDKLT